MKGLYQVREKNPSNLTTHVYYASMASSLIEEVQSVDIERRKPQVKAIKKNYRSPSLIPYGHITKITEGGFTSAGETDAPLTELPAPTRKDYRT